MHRVAEARRLQVIEGELLLHISDKVVLSDEYQMLAHMFKGLDLVMKLDEDRLGRHLPRSKPGKFRHLPCHTEF